VVRVNDRGPFVGSRIADLSHAAAAAIGMVRRGIATARIEVLTGSHGGD
jgi:rare lipoprotein A